jgi:hypothetical protein
LGKSNDETMFGTRKPAFELQPTGILALCLKEVAGTSHDDMMFGTRTSVDMTGLIHWFGILLSFLSRLGATAFCA